MHEKKKVPELAEAQPAIANPQAELARVPPSARDVWLWLALSVFGFSIAFIISAGWLTGSLVKNAEIPGVLFGVMGLVAASLNFLRLKAKRLGIEAPFNAAATVYRIFCFLLGNASIAGLLVILIGIGLQLGWKGMWPLDWLEANLALAVGLTMAAMGLAVLATYLIRRARSKESVPSRMLREELAEAALVAWTPIIVAGCGAGSSVNFFLIVTLPLNMLGSDEMAAWVDSNRSFVAIFAIAITALAIAITYFFRRRAGREVRVLLPRRSIWEGATLIHASGIVMLASIPINLITLFAVSIIFAATR